MHNEFSILFSDTILAASIPHACHPLSSMSKAYLVSHTFAYGLCKNYKRKVYIQHISCVTWYMNFIL